MCSLKKCDVFLQLWKLETFGVNKNHFLAIVELAGVPY